ncbi:MAG: peptidoglycan-binding protein [Moorea sp. SIO2B7]|nr:peptidoglycan-binding protein [Moorena sp. SIO2B7]
METLSYLYLTLAYETVEGCSDCTGASRLRDNTFSSEIREQLSVTCNNISLLSLIVILNIVAMASRTLAAVKEGDHNSQVTTLQQNLQQLGYLKANPTGYFGTLTKEAVINFQQAKGLTPDGIVGSQTWVLLEDKTKTKITPSQSTINVNPSPSQSSSNRSILRKGDRNYQVTTLQQNLQGLGYLKANPTGYFGTLTKEAVINFQQAKGLTPDGIVGSQTWMLLEGNTITTITSSQSPIKDNLSPNQSPTSRSIRSIIKKGDRNSQVTTLQQYLRGLGYLKANPTGYFGTLTKEAVINFQQAKGLTPDGIVGSQTWALLEGNRRTTPTTTQGSIKPNPSPNQRPSSRLRTTPTTTQGSIKPNPSPNQRPSGRLRIGDRSESVRIIQRQLEMAGFYQGSANGIFDLSTEDAVRSFQRARGLTVDGIVGAKTRAILPQLTGYDANPKVRRSNRNVNYVGSAISPAKIQQLQWRLRNAGFYRGPLNGIWGVKTQRAVEAAQRYYKISTSDVINQL